MGLLLGPALRFAMERIWQLDDASKSQSWKLLNSITSSQIVDPVVASVALRTIAERVESEADVAGLLVIITNATDRPSAGAMVSRLARFVGMTFTDRTVQPAIGKAWSRVAEAVASLGDRNFADAARFLLWSLYERADFSDAAFVARFGLASRAPPQAGMVARSLLVPNHDCRNPLRRKELRLGPSSLPAPSSADLC